MKVLVADDHPIFRKGLKDIIETKLVDCTVLEAENGLEAQQIVETEKPDIAILDIDMPEEDGLKACRAIRKKELPVKIIILTMYKQEEVFNAAMDSGADAYVLKDNSAQEVIESIDQVMINRQFISPEMQSHLHNLGYYKKRKGSIEKLLNTLTQTELKTLEMVSDNRSSQEIADMLFVTRKSVENYRSRICKKLGLEGGNNALVRWVLENKDLLASFDELHGDN